MYTVISSVHVCNQRLSDIRCCKWQTKNSFRKVKLQGRLDTRSQYPLFIKEFREKKHNLNIQWHGVIIPYKFRENMKEHIGLNNTGVVKRIYIGRESSFLPSFETEIKKWKRAKVKSNSAQTRTFLPEAQEAKAVLWTKIADSLSWEDFITVAQWLLASSSGPLFNGTELLRPWWAIMGHVAAKSIGSTQRHHHL